VEGFEGTNEAIKRGGMLGRKDAVMVKVAKPDQDMRFDVPVIGVATIGSRGRSASSRDRGRSSPDLVARKRGRDCSGGTREHFDRRALTTEILHYRFTDQLTGIRMRLNTPGLNRHFRNALLAADRAPQSRCPSRSRPQPSPGFIDLEFTAR